MSDELRTEYEFDYRQARPNRFATTSHGQQAPASEVESPEDHLQPSDIVDEVRGVLAAAHRGKGDRPNYLTAFQILDRLPESIRSRLIRERSGGGRDAGTAFAAPSVVSRAARMAGAEVEYLDSVGLMVEVVGLAVKPSFEVCAVYRLPTAEPAEV